MTRLEPARAVRNGGEAAMSPANAAVIRLPLARPAAAGPVPASYWTAADASDRNRTRRRMPFWAAAVAAHLALAALFLVTLTQPSEPPPDDVHIELVAPPAPPRPEAPPPKPVEAKETPKPKPITQHIISRPVLKKVPPPVTAPPVPAMPAVSAPPQPEPPPEPPAASAAPSAPPPDYVSKLYAHLSAYKHYPRAALQAHIQGTVLVRFTIDRDGRVHGETVEKSTGHADLDAEALSTLERAQPLPPPPPELAAPREMTIPIQFAVR